MRKLNITSPGMLLIGTVIAASCIFLLDLFYLQPLVDAQRWSALQERAYQAKHAVELAISDRQQELLVAAEILANDPAVVHVNYSGKVKKIVPGKGYAVRGRLKPDLVWWTDAHGQVLGYFSGIGAGDVDSAASTLDQDWLLSAQKLSDGVETNFQVGLARISTGRVIFARAQIPTRSRKSQKSSHLWIAQYLDDTFLDKLGSLVGGQLSSISPEAISPGDQSPHTSISMHIQSVNILVANWPIHNLSGKLIGYFRVELPSASICKQAVVSHRIILIVMSLSAGVALLVIMGTHILISGPLIRLLRRLADLDADDGSRHEDLTQHLHGEPLMLACQLESAFDRLATMSRTDELTGLANRRYLEQALGTFYSQSRRYNRSLSLMMIDVDFFKAVNDTGGHQAGDELLKVISQAIRDACRQSDLPARVGGDEFCVLLPETAATEAVVVAERIRLSVEKEIFKIKTLEMNVTASIGITDLNASEIDSADAMLAIADEALYMAKKLGRNKVVQAHDVSELNREAELKESDKVETLSRKLAGLDNKFKEAIIHGLEELVQVLAERDANMADHSYKVQHYAGIIATEMELPSRVVKRIEIAAMLHDIGMSALPDDVLLCPGTLTDEQMLIMRRHPLLGVRIMEGMEFLEQEIPAVRYHHENYDGSGYPEGIAGATIPLTARILAVADAFDAMVTPRTFRKAKGFDETIKEIARGAGKQFDPVVVEAMLSAARRLGPDMVVHIKHREAVKALP